jgi:hypothetical protein
LVKGKHRAAYNHMPAAEVKRLVGADVWNSYYKFTVARNPWDAVISMYHWAGTGTLEDFLSSETLALLRKNYSIYAIDGEVAVDRICRFESLAADLGEVYERLDLPLPLELPRAKGASRADKRPYRESFSDEQSQVVRTLFKEEIALLGYEF